METKNEYCETSKSALRVFASISAVVYGVALTYCYLTQHFFELKLVGVATTGLAIFVIWTYKKM